MKIPKYLSIGTFILIFMSIAQPSRTTNKIRIVIDPAGDVDHRGRTLHENYERSETLLMTEELKNYLEEHYNVSVLITRSAGEEKEPWQAATFANRIHADLFISLSLYPQARTKPCITIYQLAYHLLTDFIERKQESTSFLPVEQAHLKKIHQSKQYGTRIQHELTHRFNKLVDAQGIFALPVKPLVGVTRPAILCEIGMSHDRQWESLIEPLAESIMKCF